MTTANDARKAHKILDDLFKGNVVLDEEREFLRRFLPELPKQKTLEEITTDVLGAWSCTSDNYWGGNSCDPNISIKDWLGELHAQLKGLKDAPATVPALPAGMRIAEHEVYGRVVVSTKKDVVGCYAAFRLGNWNFSGVADHYVSPDALTFIDTEPANPAPTHPEFLETEADYENAPEGTIVARDGENPCHKLHDKWLSFSFLDAKDNRGMSRAHRRVLRLGWCNE